MNQPAPPAGSWPPPPPPPPPPAGVASREPWFTPAGGQPVQLSAYAPRAAAFLLDALIVFGLYLGATLVIGFLIGIGIGAGGGSVDDVRPSLQIVSVVVALLTALAYPVMLMSRKGEHNGQTWGKQATGIRVVRDDGQPMNIGRGLLREGVGKQLLALITLYLYLVVDYLWPLWDPENQALHDKIASTHVVVARRVAAGGVAPAVTPVPAPSSRAPVPSAVPPAPPPPAPGQTYGGFAPPSSAPPPPGDPAGS